MELPRFVVIGHDAIKQVGEVCASLKIGRHALLVADPTTMKIAGETALHSLQERKIRTEEYLIHDADWDAVLAAKEILTSKDVDYALGVGGGRSIDVAKLSAFQAGVPFVSVPTAASHDGVVSSQASIEKDGQKQSFHAQTPIASKLGMSLRKTMAIARTRERRPLLVVALLGLFFSFRA